MNKLQAVQEILSRNGRRPTTVLDPIGPSDMFDAERWLDREELAVQSEGWHYNRRSRIKLSPILITFNNASWTEATKTLSQVGAFADASVGQTLSITSGSGVVTGEYTVATIVSDDAVTLAASIADPAGDIASGVQGLSITNVIRLPSYVTEADTSGVDFWKNFTHRGGRLLDLHNNTDQFEGEVEVEYVERLEFGCIPLAIRRYIMLRAAQRFAEEHKTDQFPVIKTAVKDAKTEAMRYNDRAEDSNVLDRADSLTRLREVSGYRVSSDIRRV